MMTDDQHRADARLYVRQRRAFRIHATVYAVSMIIIFVVNATVNVAADLAGEWRAWWSVWALLGWGLGVTVHGLVLRMARSRLLGSAWEERQIDELLSSEEAEQPR